jgi:hypothetical protein
VIVRLRRFACPLALALAVTIAASPLVSARAAFAADESSPPAGSGSGSGTTVSQANKAIGLLFMIMKLVELLQNVDLPEGGGPPPPLWGSHPDPLPVIAPSDL